MQILWFQQRLLRRRFSYYCAHPREGGVCVFAREKPGAFIYCSGGTCKPSCDFSESDIKKSELVN